MPPSGDAAGAVLAKLKFAVAPSPTVDDALKILVSLRPDLIVAREEDAARIRLECPENRSVLAVTDGHAGRSAPAHRGDSGGAAGDGELGQLSSSLEGANHGSNVSE